MSAKKQSICLFITMILGVFCFCFFIFGFLKSELKLHFAINIIILSCTANAKMH